MRDAPVYARLRGRVVNGIGDRVAEAHVGLWVPGAARAESSSTDHDGRFELAIGGTGEFVVAAGHAEHGYARLESVRLEADVDRELSDLVLHGCGSIEGSCVDPTGAPVGELLLRVTPSGCRWPDADALVMRMGEPDGSGLRLAQMRSDQRGCFRIVGLAAREFTLTIPGARSVVPPLDQVRVRPGDAPVHLVVDSYRLCVRIVDERGLGLLEAYVRTCRRGFIVEHQYVHREDGKCWFDVGPDEDVTITASMDEHVPVEERLHIDTGRFLTERTLVLLPAPSKG